MTKADISMIKAMLLLIRDDAKERKENRTADQLDTVINALEEHLAGNSNTQQEG